MLDRIRAQIDAGARVDRTAASWLWEQASDEELRDLATRVRARYHPPDQATYLVMGIVNYTNICVARCDYCAFYRFPGAKDGYLLTPDQVARRIAGIISLGGTMVSFNGGFHPGLRIEDYTHLFQGLRARFPQSLTYYEMTVAEFMFVCKRTGISYQDGARRFKDSGTRWISGGGSEVLADGFRLRHSPGKYKVDDFYEAQGAVLDAGLGSTATMVIGFDETLDERLDHLDRLRAFQDQRASDGGACLASFLCW
ncbi:MAG: radical SAM protein, partial [Oligoflexia bacterium]|nr:radical SAM protein [Oligoflexia bacterium]